MTVLEVKHSVLSDLSVEQMVYLDLVDEGNGEVEA